MPVGDFGAEVAALRGSTRGPDISRFLSDVPMDINAFDYYAQTLDKTVPIMDVLTDKGFAVTTTDEPMTYKLAPVMDNPNVKVSIGDDELGVAISKRAPVMDVLTGKGFAVTDIGGPLIAKIAPVMDNPTGKGTTGDDGVGAAIAKRAGHGYRHNQARGNRPPACDSCARYGGVWRKKRRK